jgi:hypothetical protein
VSERLLSVRLDEVKFIRLRCKPCGAVVEVKPEGVIKMFKSGNGKCPVCAVPFGSGGNERVRKISGSVDADPTPIPLFAALLKFLASSQEAQAEVELALPPPADA